MDLFPWEYFSQPTGAWRYDMTPDGERFLMIAVGEANDDTVEAGQIVVVQNFFTELERLVPTG